ncbi:MAG: class I SAM-dependent methyltransferase [Nitrospirota bacterium]
MKKYGVTTCSGLGVPQQTAPRRTLLKCMECGSITVYPKPADSEIEKYYANYAEIDNCFVDGKGWYQRPAYEIVLNICKKLGKGNILDIGCADGQLLYMLPESFQKYGIDISEKACGLARKKGISVSCSVLESAIFSNKFDMIIALDFFEHIHNPWEAMNIISDLLNPGGYVVFETGNADSFAAKFLKEDWSYTAIYGHLCILTSKTLQELAIKSNIRKVLLKKGWHARPTTMKVIHRNVLSMGFHAFRLIYRMLEPLTKRIEYLRRLYQHAPPGAPHPDHMIFVGKKEL